MVILKDFVLFHIIEPGKKVYFKTILGDQIYATESLSSANVFVNRLQAQDKVEEIKRLFDIDFIIEVLK